MTQAKEIDGYFWFEIHAGHYCVASIDPSRKERDGRNKRTWTREWHAESIRDLRDHARRDGVVLPRNTKALCLEHRHLEHCRR